MTKRVLPKYFINTKRDKQYDDALHEYLRGTWKLPGRTHTQIARSLGLGDPSQDRDYGLAIMYALHEFSENDDETVSWYPNLRLKESDLKAKRDKSKHNDFHLKFYKHSPQRKEIDREPGKTDEVVKSLMLSLIGVKGEQSGNSILAAMQMKLGHISERAVDRCLDALSGEGRLIADRINKTRIVHRLPSDTPA